MLIKGVAITLLGMGLFGVFVGAGQVFVLTKNANIDDYFKILIGLLLIVSGLYYLF